jgi:acetolactate synthase-1/2/3 large subunit
MAIPVWNQQMKLAAYLNRLPPAPKVSLMEQVLRLISRARKPVIYCGGGCLHASKELREFVELTGIPVTSTLMGLGTFPASDELYLQMLGMHGTVYANYAIDQSDCLLAFGVRFDDRVTGKLEAFASRANIVHIDIDPAEIGKNKQPHVSICADVQLALAGMIKLIKEVNKHTDLDPWCSNYSGSSLPETPYSCSVLESISDRPHVGFVLFFSFSNKTRDRMQYQISQVGEKSLMSKSSSGQ